MTYTATIGSITHGTLRSEDLLEAFADELERLNRASGVPHDDETLLIEEARGVLYRLQNDPDDRDRDAHEAASGVISDLQDMLQEHAPDYCYFGPLEGDGSDFGFWPDLEQIESAVRDGELVSIDDPSERDDYEGTPCLYVNDHGNVTLYGADGRVIWDCV